MFQGTMSTKGARNNLGTVVECSETGEDASSSAAAAALQPPPASHLRPIGSADSDDDVVIVETCEADCAPATETLRTVEANVIVVESGESGLGVPPPQQQLPDQRQQAQTQTLTAAAATRKRSSFSSSRSGGSSESAPKQPHRQSGPFSASRLNLITFLNNIATSGSSGGGAGSSKRRADEKANRSQSISATKGKAARGSIEVAVDADGAEEDGEALKTATTLLPAMEECFGFGSALLPKKKKSSLASESISGGALGNRDASESAESVNMLSAASHSAGDPSASGAQSDKLSTGSSVDGSSCASAKQKLRECPICATRQVAGAFPKLTNCGHRSCRSCLGRYLHVEIMESRTLISCLECSEPMHANDIHALLDKQPFLLERYESFALRRVLSADPDIRWCPAPDCTYAVIAKACAACPQLECERPGCGAMFCYHCKGFWHANQTCDQAREGYLRELVEAVNSAAAAGGAMDEPSSSGAFRVSYRNTDSRAKSGAADIMKACPRCGALIMKMQDGSCNHMVCALCGVEFCWLCLKQINELHYLSPTGCTFWGKKPWTRKKKLLWQIGTLIGAPLGIALIAGLAVPGIICGVPIFVGRKTYQRFHGLSRTKRHLVTAVSVAGSLIVSPVLAVMAVGVGVPIMLAYVYGVVPLSLCRNGGCGGGAGSSAAEAAYGEEEEDGEGMQFPGSDAQERSRLLRGMRAEESGTVSRSNSQNERAQKSGGGRRQKWEVLISVDCSATSSPTAMNAGGEDVVSEQLQRCSSGEGITSGRRSSGGGGGGGAGKSKSVGSSCHMEIGASHAQQQPHKRRQSTESGINSLGEKVNTEDASVKAIAGSQCNNCYDDRSVWSNGGGQGGQAEVASYNEDAASTMACGGSVLGSRSLGESSCTMPSHLQLAAARAERDTSPMGGAHLSAPTAATCMDPSAGAGDHPAAEAAAPAEQRRKGRFSLRSFIRRPFGGLLNDGAPKAADAAGTQK